MMGYDLPQNGNSVMPNSKFSTLDLSLLCISGIFVKR